MGLIARRDHLETHFSVLGVSKGSRHNTTMMEDEVAVASFSISACHNDKPSHGFGVRKCFSQPSCSAMSHTPHTLISGP
jgi:hypothetical protein